MERNDRKKKQVGVSAAPTVRYQAEKKKTQEKQSIGNQSSSGGFVVTVRPSYTYTPPANPILPQKTTTVQPSQQPAYSTWQEFYESVDLDEIRKRQEELRNQYKMHGFGGDAARWIGSKAYALADTLGSSLNAVGNAVTAKWGISEKADKAADKLNEAKGKTANAWDNALDKLSGGYLSEALGRDETTAKIAELDQLYNKAEEVQRYKQYEKTVADFEKRWKESGIEARLNEAMSRAGGPTEDVMNAYHEDVDKYGFTDEEIAAYRDAKKRLENRKDTETVIDNAEEMIEKYPFLGSVTQTLANRPRGLVSSVPGALNAVWYQLNGEPVDWYDPMIRAGQVKKATTEKVTESIDSPIGQQVYQLGDSALDSAAVAALTYVGVPTWAGAAMMGGNAAQQTMLDAKERGLDDAAAVDTGIAAGIAETLFERISLESFVKLGGINGSTPTARTGQFIKNWVKQAAVEGSEEIFTSIANQAFDRMRNGGLSEYESSVRQYMADGMSRGEAEKRATTDFCKQLGMDFAGGFALGGLMGGGGTAINTSIQNRAYNERYGGKNLQQSIDTALEADAENAAAKVAQEQLASGKKVSGGQVRTMMQTAAKTEAETKIKTAAQERLETLGEKNAAEVADAVTSAMTGQMDEDNANALKKSQYGQRVLNELTDTTGGTSNAWTENIDTKLVTTGKQKENAIREYNAKLRKAMQGNVLTTEDTAALEESYGKAGAEVFAKMKPEGIDEQLYYHAFNTAYIYGNAGASVEQAIDNVPDLPEAAVRAAWAAGMGRAEFNTQQASEKMAAQTTGIKRGAGTFRMKNVTWNALSDTQKANVYVARALAKVTSLNVEVFESRSNAKGDIVDDEQGSFNADTYTLRVDVNAGIGNINDTADTTMLKVMSHELTHFIQHANPVGYKALKEFVTKELIAKGLDIDKLVQSKIDREMGNISADRALDEVIADACEDMLGNTEAIDRLAKENWNLFKHIHNWLRDFHRKLKAALDSGFRHAEAQAMLDRTAELQKLWDDAFTRAVQNYQQTGEGRDAVEMTNESGETVAVNDGNGHVQASMRTYREGGREQLKTYLEQRVKDKAITREEADDMISQMDDMYKLCQSFADQYALFGQWSEAEVRVDPKTGDPIFSVVKANGEYAMNLDFSLVCKKRRTLDAVFSQMISDGIMEDFEMKEASIAAINDIIRDHGFETACALCFVDSKRYRQGIVADAFVGMYNELVRSMIKDGQHADAFNFGGNSLIVNDGKGIDTLKDSDLDFTRINEVLKTEGKKTVLYKIAKDLKENPADRKLLMRGDFMSAKAFDTVKETNQRIMGLYNAKKGAGGPKASSLDVQYLGEIIGQKKFNAEKAYSVGGVRIQSFSDYMPRLVFDYMQMIADLHAKSLPAHAYTKEPLFILQFGLTGIKGNMSLVPEVIDGGVAPGLDKDRNYAWRDGQSFGSTVYGGSKAFIQKCYEIIGKKYNGQDRLTAAEGYELAKAIQNAPGYGVNCGTIAVGVSDEHIRKMLRDPDIRMVIPYHKSSLNHIVAVMTNIDKYNDYTDQQNTRRADGTKLTKRQKDFNYNDALRQLGDAKAAADEYLAWCDKKGYLPKFDKFRDEEGYYKLLEDFSTYDMNGEAAPQGGVTLTLPGEDSAFGSMAELMRMGLEEDALLQGKQDAAVPEIVAEIKKTLPGIEAKQRAQKSDRTFSDPSTGERVQYSVRYTEQGDPVAVIDEDIFRGLDLRAGTREENKAAKKAAMKAAMNALKQFKNGVPVLGTKVWINGNSRREFVGSGYDEEIYRNTPELFVDKLRTSNNANDVIIAATNWFTDGKNKHGKVNYKDFAHGTVLIDVVGAQYIASVEVGITQAGSYVLYDVVDLLPVSFTIKQEADLPPAATANKSTGYTGISASNTNVPQDGPSVKTQKSTRERDTEYLELAKDPEKNAVRLQEMVNEAAKAAGYTQEAWHQTGAAFTRFNTDNELAGRTDTDTPTGLFFKPNADDIGIGGNRQMHVFLSMGKTLNFANRDEAHVHWMKNAPGYAEDQTALDTVESEYKAQYEKAEEEWDAYYQEHYDTLWNNADSMAGLDEIEKRQDKILAEWKSAEEPIRLRMKRKVTAYMRASDYDSMHLKVDGMRYGKNVESFIIFDNTGVKSADPVTYDDSGKVIPLSERFNPEQQDIRYSTRSRADISSRELLANADESVARGAAQKDALRAYQTKAKSLDEIRQKLNEQRKLIRDHESGEAPLSSDELLKAKNRAGVFAKQASRTEAELKQLEGTEIIRKMMDREQNNYRKIIEEEAALAGQMHQGARDAAILRRYNERMQKRIQEARQSLVEYRRKRWDTDTRRKLRGRISDSVKRLDTMLRNPTDQKHIPDELQGAVLEMLDVFTNDTSVFSKEKLARVTAEYQKLKSAGEESAYANLAGEYDEDIPVLLENLEETISGRRLSELSAEELQTVKDVVDHFTFMVKNENAIFVNGRRVSLIDSAESVIAQSENRGVKVSADFGKLDGLARLISTGNIKPEYFFRDIGGVLKTLWNDLLRGQSRYAMNLQKAKEAKNTIQEKTGYRQWWNDKTTYSTETEAGQKIELTLGQAMGLLATYARELTTGNTFHVTRGGFLYAEDVSKRAGLKDIKNGQVPGVRYKSENRNAHPMSVNDMEALTGWLKSIDPRTLDYVEQMVQYLSKDMSELGNETSMEMFGYRKFGEEYYFPIKSAEEFLKQEPGQAGYDNTRWKHKSFTKAVTKGANNPFVLMDFDEVWNQHVSQMCMYNGMAAAQDNIVRLLNYKHRVTEDGPSTSVKAAFKTGYGDSAFKYIDTLLSDLNGGIMIDPREGALNSMISLFKKNAVFASMSVAIQQPSSIARAMAVMDPKYLVKTAAQKRDYNELKKWSGVAIIKEIGGFDTNTGRGGADWLMAGRKATARETYENLATWLPQKMDEITWSHIWNAVKAEIADTTDLTGDEYYRRCAQRFDEVIELTQVYDSVLTRSENMRSKSGLVKAATAFMAEPTTTLNMMMDALQNAKSNPKQLARTTGAVLVSILLNNFLKALVTAPRDKDEKGKPNEDRTWIEKYVKKLTDGIKNDVNPMGYIPLLNDVQEMLEGYTVEASYASVVSDLVKAVQKAYKDPTVDSGVDALAAISGVFGVPTKNLVRDIRGVIATFVNTRPLDETTKRGLMKAVEEGLGMKTKLVDDIEKVYKTDKAGNEKARKKALDEVGLEYEDKVKHFLNAGYDRKEAEKKARTEVMKAVTNYLKPLYLAAETTAEKNRIKSLALRFYIGGKQLYNGYNFDSNWG